MKTTHTLKTTSPRLNAPKLMGDVGYDLLASHDTWFAPGQFAPISTTVRVQIPVGFWGLVIARSWANSQGQFVVLPGVIDAGFRGELMIYVWCMNRGPRQDPILVHKGTAFAQLVLVPACVFPVERIEDLGDSERGSQGYGSTGACRLTGD